MREPSVKPGFTGAPGQQHVPPTDRLLMASPRWEAACASPLVGDVADLLRPPEALVPWVRQHGLVAAAMADLAASAVAPAPAEQRETLPLIDAWLREDAAVTARWAAGYGGGDAGAPTPATAALLTAAERLAGSGSYPQRAVALWQWLDAMHLSWTRYVMCRRPASELRDRFTAGFHWRVVFPWRKQLDRTLADLPEAAWAELQRTFDDLADLLGDWQSERATLAGPAGPPLRLEPRPEARRAALPAIEAIRRLLAFEWDLERPLPPDLPEGIDWVPDYRMAVLGSLHWTPADAEAVGEPPLDELMLAVGEGAEAVAGAPERFPEWSEPLLAEAPFEDGVEAAVWTTPSARIALTSFVYDNRAPGLALAFVLARQS